MDRVPVSQWKWCGYPGHFIAAQSCLFRLSTRVGNFRISTVGDMWVTDYRDPERKKKVQEPIGVDENALYETFVFRLMPKGGEPCCGEVADWSEIDSQRYATAEEAREGHMCFCRKFAHAERAIADLRKEYEGCGFEIPDWMKDGTR